MCDKVAGTPKFFDPPGGGVQVFFLEDLDLYVVSHFDGELYRLGFAGLRTRLGLKVRCDRLEEEAAAATELKDISRERLRLKVVFTLYSLNCFEEGAEGALALKINIRASLAHVRLG